jgi:hypothetical protein
MSDLADIIDLADGDERSVSRTAQLHASPIIAFKGRDQIRCPQQLYFLRFWERGCSRTSLPSIEILDLDSLRHVADKLMLCRVLREHGDLRFLIRYHGSQFEKAHGRKCVGRFVDEAVAPSLRKQALSMYHHVATSSEPLFCATALREGYGPIVNYERLLIPFTKSGPMVEYICCIITMVTEENGFDFNIAIKGRPVE